MQDKPDEPTLAYVRRSAKGDKIIPINIDDLYRALTADLEPEGGEPPSENNNPNKTV